MTGEAAVFCGYHAGRNPVFPTCAACHEGGRRSGEARPNSCGHAPPIAHDRRVGWACGVRLISSNSLIFSGRAALGETEFNSEVVRKRELDGVSRALRAAGTRWPSRTGTS